MVSKVVEVSTFTHNAVSLTRPIKRRSNNNDVLVVDGDEPIHNKLNPIKRVKSLVQREPVSYLAIVPPLARRLRNT